MSHTKDNMVCLLSFFLTRMNILLDLSFHFLLLFFASVSFFKFVLVRCLFLLLHLFVVKFILASFSSILLHNGCCSNEKNLISCCGG
jgi:hypothetical protein